MRDTTSKRAGLGWKAFSSSVEAGLLTENGRAADALAGSARFRSRSPGTPYSVVPIPIPIALGWLGGQQRLVHLQSTTMRAVFCRYEPVLVPVKGLLASLAEAVCYVASRFSKAAVMQEWRQKKASEARSAFATESVGPLV